MTTANLSTFGGRFAWLLKRRGQTYRSFAEAMGVTPSHVHKLCEDAYEPKLSDIVKIASELGANLIWLATRSGQPWKPGMEPPEHVESMDKRKRKAGSGEHALGVVVRKVPNHVARTVRPRR